MKTRSKERGIAIRSMGIRVGLCAFFLFGFVLNGALPAEAGKKVEAPPFEGSILGMEVAAHSLALVVDISTSMHPFLPTIRQELRQRTPRNPTLHVNGCGIEKPDPRAHIENGVAPETITAIDTLGTHTTATTILWITDMADPPNVDGIASLEELLNEKGLKLLLISVGNGPQPSIQKVIESREGYWKVLDTEKLR